MQKGNSFTLCSDAGLVVDELESGGTTPLENLVEVIDRKADVVDSRTPLSDKPGNWRFRVVRCEQLDQGFPGTEACDARAIRIVERNLGQAEDIAKKRHAGLEGLNGDADVRYAGPTRG